MTDPDAVIHQPARLRILMLLSGVESADFNFLMSALGLSKGNLSTHASRLEEAGYLRIEKGYQGKIPHTSYMLTELGKERLREYWEALEEIRGLAGATSRREGGLEARPTRSYTSA
jgi:DNA-binding transcriptional ArsR family regulator